MGFGSTIYDIFFHYSQSFFVTIAMTLGSGVLGLPTTLADSGFLPFLITIIASYIAQVLSLIFFTEALQKAYFRNIDKLKEAKKDTVPIQREFNLSSTYGSQESSTLTSQNDSSTKPADDTQIIQRCLPNMHSLGELYLPYFLPYLSTLVSFVVLVVFLISYTLAGSQLFSALTGASFYSVTPIFCWVLTFIILVFHSIISPIISILTIFKGAFFAGTIILTFIIGLQYQIPTKNNFADTGDSFLMSLVALAGFIGAMPLMFVRVKHTKNGIIGFIVSIFLALTVCLILNILWCWSVLAVVPQHSVCLPNSNTKGILMSLTSINEVQDQCIKSPSLEYAQENGEIAPIPLSLILKAEGNPSSRTLAILIQAFVIITVSVSFITVGSVLYHTLNGVVDSFWSSPYGYETRYGGFFKHITVQTIRQWFLALIIFLLIFAIGFSNPRGFNVFVQQVGSLFVAIQFGVFIVIMSYKATYSSEFRSYVIPFQLPQWFLPFQFLVPIYYICAIVYNIYLTVVLLTKN